MAEDVTRNILYDISTKKVVRAFNVDEGRQTIKSCLSVNPIQDRKKKLSEMTRKRRILEAMQDRHITEGL